MTTTGVTPTTSTGSNTAQRGLGSLKSEDFFRILVTELQHQDPLEPADTSDMINDVSQIRSIELSNELTGTLGTLARQQPMSNASGLLGKYVRAVVNGENGQPATVEGVVTGVQFDSDGQAVLELDVGISVRAQDVQRVTTLEQAESEALAAMFGATGEPTDSTQKSSAAARPFSFKPLTNLGRLLGL